MRFRDSSRHTGGVTESLSGPGRHECVRHGAKGLRWALCPCRGCSFRPVPGLLVSNPLSTRLTPWAMIFRPSGLANVEAPGDGMSAHASRTNACATSRPVPGLSLKPAIHTAHAVGYDLSPFGLGKCESSGRRNECRRVTHECVRHITCLNSDHGCLNYSQTVFEDSAFGRKKPFRRWRTMCSVSKGDHVNEASSAKHRCGDSAAGHGQ